MQSGECVGEMPLTATPLRDPETIHHRQSASTTATSSILVLPVLSIRFRQVFLIRYGNVYSQDFHAMIAKGPSGAVMSRLPVSTSLLRDRADRGTSDEGGGRSGPPR